MWLARLSLSEEMHSDALRSGAHATINNVCTNMQTSSEALTWTNRWPVV